MLQYEFKHVTVCEINCNDDMRRGICSGHNIPCAAPIQIGRRENELVAVLNRLQKPRPLRRLEAGPQNRAGIQLEHATARRNVPSNDVLRRERRQVPLSQILHHVCQRDHLVTNVVLQARIRHQSRIVL